MHIKHQTADVSNRYFLPLYMRRISKSDN